MLKATFLTILCVVALAGCAADDDAAAPASPEAEAAEADVHGARPAHAILLFGGMDGRRQPFGDTWVWDGKGWTQKNVTGPSARDSAAAAALYGKVVVFGGEARGADLDDTWVWDGAGWSKKDVSGPGKRQLAQAGTAGDGVVLHGGYHGSGLFDTWTWNGTAWSEVKQAGPPGSVGWSVATLRDHALFFGTAADTRWDWSGSKWSSTRNGAGALPGRSGAGAAVLGSKVVVFGGVLTEDDVTTANDTWIFEGGSWTRLKTKHAPSPRANFGMASLGDRVVLFGGYDDNAGGNGKLYGDTWIFDGDDWSEYTGPRPGARNSCMMVAY